VTVGEIARQLGLGLITLRRHFHQYPELSFQEVATSRKIREVLEAQGVSAGAVAETGVVGLLRGVRERPVIAIRADIDALPIQEETGAEYASRHPGVMHACGHDVHTTCALGAAMILARLRGEMPGTVKFIFQPAEEKNAGAKMLVEAGVLEDPPVDIIFGLHTQPALPAGTVGVKEGPLMAAVDTIFVDVWGRGGHGALPHRTVDPILAACAVVVSLQSVVSRNVDPLEPAVVSFGTFHGGTANNVIPDKVELSGTVRTFDPALREHMPGMLRRVIENVCAGLGARGELRYRPDLPAVSNPAPLAALARQAVVEVAGEEAGVVPAPSMGGEDFAIYQQKVPGCFLWLGVGNTEKGIVHPWHSPRFDVDENSIPLGAAVLAQVALLAMKSWKGGR